MERAVGHDGRLGRWRSQPAPHTALLPARQRRRTHYGALEAISARLCSQTIAGP